MSRSRTAAVNINHLFESTPANPKMKLSHGVAAGAEDTKYQAKYKDLKKKVKELEADNDRLHFKVLEARKNVTRMKLERAVLYERLCAVPPTDEENRRGIQDAPINSVAHPRLDQSDSRDPSVMEYIRNHSRPGGRPSVPEPSPRGPPLPFVPDQHGHSRSHSQNHLAHQSTSRMSRPVYIYTPVEDPYAEGLLPYPGAPPRGRPDPHDDHRGPPINIPIHNGNGRLHNHQRIGPGAHLNVERDPEDERPVERPPNRVPTPPFAQRSHHREEAAIPHRSSADRDAPHELVGPGLHPSRSNTPASARLTGPSRPDSRSQPTYDREHQRSAFAAQSSRAPEEREDDMQVEDGQDARKRMRDEYENGGTAGSYLPDDRTAKKSHQDETSPGEGKDVAMEAEES